MKALQERLKFFSSEMVLGGLVAILSVLVALSTYLSQLASSATVNVEAQKTLTNANAEYLEANQLIDYDYAVFDSWYLTNETDEEKADYYEDNFSPELKAAIADNPADPEDLDDPFDQDYYEAMYAEAEALFDQADQLYGLAGELDKRSDALQLVVLVSAFGLALTAWAALLKEGSPVRQIFAVIALLLLAGSIGLFVMVPPMPVG